MSFENSIKSERKSIVRSHLRRRRSAFIISKKNKLARQLRQHGLRALSDEKRIVCFLPLNEEAPINRLIHSLRSQGKEIYVPIVVGCRLYLRAAPFSKSAYKRHDLGMLEPITGRYVQLLLIDAILVPFVGIDEQGYRLGMGGGFYDQFLARTQFMPNPPKVYGVGVSVQQCSQLPIEEWDVRLPRWISEWGVQQFSGAGFRKGQRCKRLLH